MNPQDEQQVFHLFALAMWGEYEKAKAKFDPIHSHHEGESILHEEFLEYRSLVYWMDERHISEETKKRILEELTHVAVMCFRIALDKGLLD